MLKRKNILITSGPTQEPVDPVRFYSNYSSGKMGYALARVCVKAGHRVTLVSGPTGLPKPSGFVQVQTAREMFKAVLRFFKKSDIVFKVAAVADYRLKHISPKKIKKTHETMDLTFVKNPDILKHLGHIRRSDQILVGFAAETHKGVEYARKKLKEKNLDWIALNVIDKKNVGFGSDLNEVTLISSDGKKIKIPRQNKDEVAKFILRTVLKVELDESHRFDFKRYSPISFMKLFNLSRFKK